MITTIRRPVLKRCPFKDEIDAGELVIVIPGSAPELHELGQQVDNLCSDPISHEDFTKWVLSLVPEGSVVTTTWHTGPWAVEVRESSGETGS